MMSSEIRIGPAKSILYYTILTILSVTSIIFGLFNWIDAPFSGTAVCDPNGDCEEPELTPTEQDRESLRSTLDKLQSILWFGVTLFLWTSIGIRIASLLGIGLLASEVARLTKASVREPAGMLVVMLICITLMLLHVYVLKEEDFFVWALGQNS